MRICTIGWVCCRGTTATRRGDFEPKRGRHQPRHLAISSSPSHARGRCPEAAIEVAQRLNIDPQSIDLHTNSA
jgi:hypothetical protein